ncbi:hypothetical protein [Bacteriovorax sp. Seq25_V]|uniref:hypothetical protein n=1 Tax=Bacteriovorax sp. Seq25_V TaxID=1201288 RepID=UPI00038A388B|nr:hypothetical protein [Bacteriovorax sp. Seq25_V]EQC46019.1 hypothetical protein M900_1585 [Bacteriovorax sp. Seq25_V]
MKNIFKILILLSLTLLTPAQDFGSGMIGIEDDDLSVGGDIFNDFNEDLEDTQISEDERFYKYGRYFTFQIGLGITAFDGNRGQAYANDPPTFSLSINYFSDFQSAWGVGFAYSKHSMFFDEETEGWKGQSPAGFIEVSMLRTFFSYRYYVDTSNLGTAITYSNPYIVGRLEYWYVTNKYLDQDDIADDKGGGIGMALGFGLEFPIKLKESYLNLEFLLHDVAFHDKETREFTPLEGKNVGFENLAGYGYTTVLSYVWNW